MAASKVRCPMPGSTPKPKPKPEPKPTITTTTATTTTTTPHSLGWAMQSAEQKFCTALL